MDYQISNKAKTWTLSAIIVGAVVLVVGLFLGKSGTHFETRVMANLLSNSLFYFIIAISAMFFLALQYVAEVGWFTYARRPLEAITRFLPIGMILMLVTLLSMNFMNGAGVYQWMNPEIMNEGGAHYDAVAAFKGGYMNVTFFWIRTILYFTVYFLIWRGFMSRSRLQDENPSDAIRLHYKNFNQAAIFLVFFAFFSSTSAWDWIMSIDIHWRSTLFGWYVFAGGWGTAMVVLVMLLIYLKKLGYLPKLNNSHIHDIGKWIFALSFLWSYMWFSQFMLIWYSNMPEEVGYFITRVDHYNFLYFGMFFINFVFPMLILMSRDAKRHAGALAFIGIVIIIGHWLDVWIMVMGGSMGPLGKIGFIEVGMAVLFLGIFVRVVLTKLSVLPLVSVNDPYLEESIHHDI